MAQYHVAVFVSDPERTLRLLGLLREAEGIYSVEFFKEWEFEQVGALEFVYLLLAFGDHKQMMGTVVPTSILPSVFIPFAFFSVQQKTASVTLFPREHNQAEDYRKKLLIATQESQYIVLLICNIMENYDPETIFTAVLGSLESQAS